MLYFSYFAIIKIKYVKYLSTGLAVSHYFQDQPDSCSLPCLAAIHPVVWVNVTSVVCLTCYSLGSHSCIFAVNLVGTFYSGWVKRFRYLIPSENRRSDLFVLLYFMYLFISWLFEKGCIFSLLTNSLICLKESTNTTLTLSRNILI